MNCAFSFEREAEGYMEDELIPPAFLADMDIFVTFVNNNHGIFLKVKWQWK